MDYMKNIIPSKVRENLTKVKEEDRRFFMNVINQNVQILQSQGQFKMNSFLSYFAVYLSSVAVLIALEKINPYFFIATVIFCVGVFILFSGKNESKLIRLQSEVYRAIQDYHFHYLDSKKKK